PGRQHAPAGHSARGPQKLEQGAVTEDVEIAGDRGDTADRWIRRGEPVPRLVRAGERIQVDAGEVRMTTSRPLGDALEPDEREESDSERRDDEPPEERLASLGPHRQDRRPNDEEEHEQPPA